MKISLVRHRMPDTDLLSSIRVRDFPAGLYAYDEADIDRSLPPDVVRRGYGLNRAPSDDEGRKRAYRSLWNETGKTAQHRI